MHKLIGGCVGTVARMPQIDCESLAHCASVRLSCVGAKQAFSRFSRAKSVHSVALEVTMRALSFSRFETQFEV